MPSRADRKELVVCKDAKPVTPHKPIAWPPRITANVERRLKEKIDALIKDSSDSEALIAYVSFLLIYLEIKLPDKMELLRNPVFFIFSILEQANKGSLHPVLDKKVHSRPIDGSEKQRFKVACVVAGDVYFEADKKAGLERRFSRREQADDVICRHPGLGEVAKKHGLSLTPTSIKGWRRQIREAPEGSILKYAEKGTRDLAERFRPLGLQMVGKVLLGHVMMRII